MVDRMDINRLLVEMRAIKQQAMPPQVRDVKSLVGQIKPGTELGPEKPTPAFGDLFSKAINTVNETQKSANTLAKSYEMGDQGVDITDVMIASQKASISFQAMVQVRNKLVDAYRDVMNMPI